MPDAVGSPARHGWPNFIHDEQLAVTSFYVFSIIVIVIGGVCTVAVDFYEPNRPLAWLLRILLVATGLGAIYSKMPY
jgi:hypothetical protein